MHHVIHDYLKQVQKKMLIPAVIIFPIMTLDDVNGWHE